MSSPMPHLREVRVPGAEVVLAVDEWAPASRAPRATVVFLPGFASIRTSAKAARLGAEIARRGGRLLAVDFEGHGASTGSFADLSVTRHLRDAMAVVDALAEDEPLALVGSSMGGLVAARAATRLARRARALALIAPAFGFRERFERRLGADALAHWERTNALRYVGEFFCAEIGFDLMRDARALDERALARSIETPTLIVHGTHDETVPFDCALDAAERWRAPLELVRVEGGDHRLEAHLDDVVARVSSFVLERAAGPG